MSNRKVNKNSNDGSIWGSGTYSGGVGRLGARPPPGFSESLTHHSNRKRDKEAEGYGKRRNLLFLEL